jgi:hypothetical protein
MNEAWQRLEGGGLVAFSDPAGAKACLGLAEILRRRGQPVAELLSNRSYPFFSLCPQPVQVQHTARLDRGYPWVFVGTSHPDSSQLFELEICRQARERSLPTIAFVDHGTNLALRFRRGQELQLPDQIWLVDESAHRQALQEGLPAERLHITGNPYLAFIRDFWQANLEVEAALQALPARRILFVPDPISLRNEGQWQFDEVDVLAQLLAWLEQRPEVGLLLKTHPLQPREKLVALTDQCPAAVRARVHWDDSLDPLDLSRQARVTVGFHSNALREIDCLGNSILRYFPHNQELDALAGSGIGERVESWSSLTAHLDRFIT